MPSATAAMAGAKLAVKDFYSVMQVVSRYETGGCWAGATGNSDGQWLSLGVMQWNFGQGSLQPILARFRSKFSDTELTEQLARLMPVFGKQLFARSCTAKPIEQACITFLKTQYMRDGALQPAFKAETDRLFESDVMRQIQVDYFARSLTTILDDLSRIFHTAQPEAWMVAWAMGVFRRIIPLQESGRI